MENPAAELLRQQAAQVRLAGGDLAESQAAQLEAAAEQIENGSTGAPAPGTLVTPPFGGTGQSASNVGPVDYASQAEALEAQAQQLRAQQIAQDAPPVEPISLDSLDARVTAIEAELHVR